MASDLGDFSYADDEELVAQFLSWTGDAVTELRSLTDSLDSDNAGAADRIYDLCHNIKGMGASFNYGLMTETGTSLCRYIKHHEGALSRRVVDAHVRIFEVVLTNKITGDGGDKGRALLTRLTDIIAEEAK
jgi:hypothetical protein